MTITKIADAQWHRLPVYVRDYITELRGEVQKLRTELSTLRGQQQTSIEINPYRNDGVRVFVEEHETIRYTLSNGRIDVRLRHGRLNINSVSLGEHVMDIRPCASNDFSVGFSK